MREFTPFEPVFAFGFERSGTTLLNMMLGAHPMLALPHAVNGLWFDLERELAPVCSPLHELRRLPELATRLVAEPLIRRWDVRLDRDEVLESLRPGDFSSVVAACHRAYARSKRKTHWGNLDIATLDYMDRVNAWFPTARFLHIVRDGRDVALSHRTMPYGATNAVDCALAWRHRLHANLKMGAMVGMERYRVVRYEDLIQDPERTLEGICHFLGIEYCSDMLRYPEMVREKIPEDRRWLWPAIDQPPDQGKIERWRREMSSSARLSFEAEAGDVLRKLGYPCPELVPRTLGRFGYEAWCFADRGGRFRRLGTRLGIQRASALERQAIRREEHRRAFGALVREGVYGADFIHPDPLRRFFREVLSDIPRGEGPIHILEAGCGNGAWLQEAATLFTSAANERAAILYGFDLTPEMIEVARCKLRNVSFRGEFTVGDALDPESYQFESVAQGFDLVFAFDVVQQVPRPQQLKVCLSVGPPYRSHGARAGRLGLEAPS